MLNPNISKRVTVQVKLVREYPKPYFNDYIGIYKGMELEIGLRLKNIKPGNRRLYLKYSILNDRYYLSDVG